MNKNCYLNERMSNLARNMPDMSGKNIVMGFWHNWASSLGDGYQQGRFADMNLTDIPEQYNIVAVAFMKGHGIPTFKPHNLSDSEFLRQVNVLNAQGRAVLISLGGADAEIALFAGQEEALANEIIRLVETYGFNGLDIDLEQSAIAEADNRTVIPAALKKVKDRYKKEGKNFIISMAPEFPHLRINGDYQPYIQALEGYYDFIAPQYYNQGGDGVWVDETNSWLAQNNDERKDDFLFYLTDSLINGTRGFIRIPHDKFLIGLPSNVDAAATGYVINPQHLFNALDRLKSAKNPIRGVMTWSVNWDNGKSRNNVPYNWEFITRYGHISGGGSVPSLPSAPTNLTSSCQTQSSISLCWVAGSQHPIAYYTVYRDGNKVSTVSANSFVDTGLQPGRQYIYQVSATDSQGQTSSQSNVLQVSTLSSAIAEWTTGSWYDDNYRVQYKGNNYICVMQHTSNHFWSPDLATTLWVII